MPEIALRDRVVVVTGAAGGIGAALARAFVGAGARVVLLDNDPERLDVVLRSLPDGRAHAIPLDVTDAVACDAVFERIRAEHGGVDILVNNAGISHRSLFADTAPDVIRRVMEVNFFGAVSCTRAAVPSLVERRGLIVAISSVAGFAPLIGRAGYCASKHALHGFFDTLRTELEGTGVDVTLVCPSFIATGLEQRALSGSGEALGRSKRAVAGAVTSPDALAAAIVRAATRRRRLVAPSAVSRGSLWLSRLAPRLYDRLMLRSQREEFIHP